MKKIQSNKVARIFQEPTGLWYFCPDNLDNLSTDYSDGYYAEAGAIRAARESGKFTHRTNRHGKRVKL